MGVVNFAAEVLWGFTKEAAIGRVLGTKQKLIRFESCEKYFSEKETSRDKKT